jgi:hypothetical protein
VKSCDPVRNPSNGSSPTGGVEKYILNPTNVASILATSPVTTYYDFWDHIPMYDTITPEMKTKGIPPLSFMSYGTTDYYDIPVSYVKEALFGQSAQCLVQGILTQSPVNTTQYLSLSSTFGASNPLLLFAVLGTFFICAVITTFVSWSKRHVKPMDVIRILAISRNPNLDNDFGRYSDRWVEIDDDEKMLNAKVGYGYVDELKRHALVLSHIRASDTDTLVGEDGDDKLQLLDS